METTAPNTSADVGKAAELHTSPYEKRKALKKKKKKKLYNNYLSHFNKTSKKITAKDILIKTGQTSYNEDFLNESYPEEIDKFRWTLEQLDYKPDPEHIKIIVDESKKNRVDPDVCVAIVASESSFRPTVVHYNGGSNDYGLFQLNNLWHNQHRGNVPRHIRTGIEHFRWCMKTENNNIRKALSRYNTGGSESSAGRKYANYVLGNKRKIDSKASKYASHIAAVEKEEKERQKKRRLSGTEGM